jgi:hypothetical protein
MLSELKTHSKCLNQVCLEGPIKQSKTQHKVFNLYRERLKSVCGG